MDITAIIDRVAAAAMVAMRTLGNMPTETLAIVIIGAIATAAGLGCLIVGLLGEWREWARIHIHRRHHQ